MKRMSVYRDNASAAMDASVALSFDVGVRVIKERSASAVTAVVLSC